LFLAFTIAAMKQIAAADMPEKKRRDMLAGVVCDELTQRILHDADCQYRSRLRRILFWAMRRKLHDAVYLLLKMQLFRNRRS
jgi:hypothetical protein